MTMDYDQNGDLQQTVMIPVLSLNPQAQPNPAADTGIAFGATAAFGAHKRNVADAADTVCERILQTAVGRKASENPILSASKTLLMMAVQLRTAAAPKNSTHFSQILIDAVREFDRDLLHTQLRHETALVARYILCCTIDESVLSTSWGISSGWAHRSLLRLFHNEANGGDRFFALLEHAMTRQQECRDLLEVFYLCLSLGFEGRFHLDPRGHDKIETLRMQLYRTLYREQPRDIEFATQWRPNTNATPLPKQKSIHAWVLGMAFIVSVFCGLRLWLDTSADSAVSTLGQVFQINPGSGS